MMIKEILVFFFVIWVFKVNMILKKWLYVICVSDSMFVISERIVKK